jgi:hypothetical protein
MIKVSMILNTLGDLRFGRDQVTHIYVGCDLWEFFHVLCDRVRDLDGSIPFQGVKVVLVGRMPGFGAHFHNANNPHHPSYNRYVDWTDCAHGIGPQL